MYLFEETTISNGKTISLALSFDMMKMFGIPQEWYLDSDKIELWATSVTDSGPDYCIAKFFKDNNLVHEQKIKGY